MYRVTGVTKQYNRGKEIVHALRGVDVAIPDGDMLVIQGPTGHGKSTLLQLLGGLDRPTSGSLEFDGRDLAKLGETQLTRLRAENFGYVFQSFNLIPTLTAQENVETALVPLGVPAQRRRERAARALAEVGLGDRAGHLPTELSGGQQQRAAIARALVKEPKVILADEPTGNLDEDTRDDIFGVLESLWQERGLTVILVTHDSAIAHRVPRLALIKSGKLTIKREPEREQEVQAAPPEPRTVLPARADRPA
jgi:putative ABC transport system ATP-binding protein